MPLPRLVVVGRQIASATTPAIITSDDGIAWTPQTPAVTPVSAAFGAVAFGGDKFLAANSRGGATFNTQYSTDAITWTLFSAGFTKRTIAYGNGTWVAVANSNSATSPDGLTWTDHTAVLPNSNWNTIVFGNGVFVAVGESLGGSYTIASSVDGVTWTSMPTTVPWVDVTFGAGIFVVTRAWSAASSGTIVTDGTMTSTDGVTWTAQTSYRSGWGVSAYGNGMFLVLGGSLTGSTAQRSADGVTWTYHTGTFAPGNRIAFASGLFVVPAGGNIWTSADGLSWSTTTFLDRFWSDITAGPPTTPRRPGYRGIGLVRGSRG